MTASNETAAANMTTRTQDVPFIHSQHLPADFFFSLVYFFSIFFTVSSLITAHLGVVVAMKPVIFKLTVLTVSPSSACVWFGVYGAVHAIRI